jgi:hypothetical protein
MHDELNINNHNQHCVGVAALPKIHHNDKNLHRAIFFKETNPKKNGMSARRRRNRRKNSQCDRTTSE